MKLNKYLLALTCSFAALAHAEGSWYILGSAGQSKFDGSKSDFDSSLNAEGFGVISSSLDDSDTAYKLQVGYQFNPNFALEGGYVDLGELTYKADITDGFLIYDAKAKIEAEGWNIDAVGILPLGNNFSLFAKFGMIDAKVKISAKVSRLGITGSASDSSTDIKPLLGIGAAYAIGNVSIRAEFERYKNLGDEDTTGESDVDLLSAGISYKF